jgi:6,7-dimethyl-8-ribityllumazine synthase
MKRIEGKLDATGLKFGIVVSRFNDFISGKLLSGAVDALIRHGANDDDIETAWVPGAFEIPMLAKKMAQKGGYDAIICLGAIIKGDTPHFDFVAAESAKGIAQLSFSSDIPVTYGIITTNDVEQAINRAGLKSGNKGFDAAVTSIEMANLNKHFV